ncbi:MAG TPA: hypothetical protein VGO09_04720, partial [Flavisolibacter sp.]|nr:hypothetical protein [Flavisolibacter sp.]
MFSLTVSKSYATTWDEPWADSVITKSNSFVLAKVLSCDPKKGVTIHILRSLGGEPLFGTIIIRGFYLLHLCSTSGQGVE